MNTLLVKYTIREKRSGSKKLLDVLKNEINNSEIKVLDLCIDIPDMFNVESVNAKDKIQNANLQQSLDEVRKIAKEWYGN